MNPANFPFLLFQNFFEKRALEFFSKKDAKVVSDVMLSLTGLEELIMSDDLKNIIFNDASFYSENKWNLKNLAVDDCLNIPTEHYERFLTFLKSQKNLKIFFLRFSLIQPDVLEAVLSLPNIEEIHFITCEFCLTQPIKIKRTSAKNLQISCYECHTKHISISNMFSLCKNVTKFTEQETCHCQNNPGCDSFLLHDFI